jgi:signal transduction histidine kinase
VVYLIQFSLLLVGTVGFLLLMKEADDQLLLESEQRERQRRTLQSNFIDMLTHELRAALAVVKISSSSLKRQLTDQPPELTRRVENIGRATDSMSAIVDRCIELERLDRGEQSIHLSECILLDVVTALDVVCGPDNPRLRIELNDVDSVLADRHLLEVALGNLIDNALKYALPGTPITLRSDAEQRDGKPGFRLSVDNQVAAGSAPAPGRCSCATSGAPTPTTSAAPGSGSTSRGSWPACRAARRTTAAAPRGG